MDKELLKEDESFFQYFPVAVRYFSQINILRKEKLEDRLPNIKQIISSVIDHEVLSIRLGETIEGLSNEGTYSSGKKALVDLKFKEKIMYISDTVSNSVHIMESQFYYTEPVIVPNKIQCLDIDKLIKKGLLKAEVKNEYSVIKTEDNRTVIMNLFFLLELYKENTPNLCFSAHENDKSNIFILCDESSQTVQQTFNENCKNVKPIWSSDKETIVFMSTHSGNCMINMIDVKTGNVREVANLSELRNIKSFCLCNKVNKIVFSEGNKFESNLFSLDIETSKYSQMTFTEKKVKNFRPKSSSHGVKVGFLREKENKRSLCIMDSNGDNLREIVCDESIKDFNWCDDNKSILYIKKDRFKVCRLYRLNLNTLREIEINIDEDITSIHSAVSSHNNRFIAFVGSNTKTEDIYVLITDKGKILNITNNTQKAKIKDLIWKEDDSKIYYCSNELKYYNIFSIYLNDRYKKQLTDIKANNIEWDLKR